MEKEIHLKISGMHCQSCEILLRDILESLPGVKFARIIPELQKAMVFFNESQIKEVEIINAVSRESKAHYIAEKI